MRTLTTCVDGVDDLGELLRIALVRPIKVRRNVVAVERIGAEVLESDEVIGENGFVGRCLG